MTETAIELLMFFPRYNNKVNANGITRTITKTTKMLMRVMFCLELGQNNLSYMSLPRKVPKGNSLLNSSYQI